MTAKYSVILKHITHIMQQAILASLLLALAACHTQKPCI
jgi:hypothetical protein